MKTREFNEKLCELTREIGKLQSQKRDLKEEYKAYLLEFNGYKIGDIVKDNIGNDCIVTGVDELSTSSFYLQCKKIKKDGTASKISAAFLEIKLKQDND